MPKRFARIPLAALLALAALATAFTPAAAAGPLSLDPLFGTSGVASGGTTVAGFHRAGGIAVTAHRAILLASEGPSGAAVARFFPDGDLDSAYAGGVGVLYLPRLAGAGVNDVAAGEGEDAFLLSGRTTVTKVTPGGSLGEAFGADGSVDVPALDPRFAALHFWSLAAQPDGGVLVAGISFGTPRMVVVRLLADGSLDPSFGEDGLATVRMGPRGSGARQIAEQPNGRILLAGYAQNRPALVRLLADGSPDPSFGRDGRVFGPRRMHGSVTALSLRPHGGIVVAGTGSTASQRISGIFVLRFGESGAFDRHFGSPNLVVPLRRYATPTAVVPLGHRVLVAATGPEAALKAFSRRGRPLGTLDGVPGIPNHQFGGINAAAQGGKLLFTWTPQHLAGKGEIRLERLLVR